MQSIKKNCVEYQKSIVISQNIYETIKIMQIWPEKNNRQELENSDNTVVFTIHDCMRFDFKYICLLTNTLQRKINWLSLLPTAEHTHFSLSLSENYRWYSSLGGLDFFFGLTYMRKKVMKKNIKHDFYEREKNSFSTSACLPAW